MKTLIRRLQNRREYYGKKDMSLVEPKDIVLDKSGKRTYSAVVLCVEKDTLKVMFLKKPNTITTKSKSNFICLHK